MLKTTLCFLKLEIMKVICFKNKFKCLTITPQAPYKNHWLLKHNIIFICGYRKVDKPRN